MQKFFADKQPAAKPTIVRLVEVTKMANSRVGVSFVMRGRSVIVHQVASTSPFEGKVFPGDLISLASDGIRALDANGLSQHIFAASSLSLSSLSRGAPKAHVRLRPRSKENEKNKRI